MGERSSSPNPSIRYPAIAQEPFNICEVHLEPLKPSQHCQERRAVFGISIFRCYDPIDHAGDYLGFIMLVGYKTIRKLVVMSVAFRAAEPADHKILFQAAFLLPDTWSAIAVLRKYRHRRGRTGVSSLLTTKNTGVRLVGQCVF